MANGLQTNEPTLNEAGKAVSSLCPHASDKLAILQDAVAGQTHTIFISSILNASVRTTVKEFRSAFDSPRTLMHHQ